MSRYERHIVLPEIGEVGQQTLKGSTVLIVGMGGLGCPAATYLAAMGIGKLKLVDNDVVSESNLQRQTLFTPKDRGKRKVDVAAKKLKAQNPEVHLEAIPERYCLENAEQLLENVDVAIDCTDNTAVRYLLNDACQINKVPMVFGGIYKFQIQLSVFQSKSKTSYRDLYPFSKTNMKPKACDEVGVLGSVPGILGTMQANEAIKVLLNLGEVLDGKVFYLDTLTYRSQIFAIKRKSKRLKKLEELPEYESLCLSEVPEMGVEEFLLRTDCALVDVRPDNEEPKSEYQTVDINHTEHQEIVLMCRTGRRSLIALQEFQKKYPHKKFYSLKGGVLELNRIFKV